MSGGGANTRASDPLRTDSESSAGDAAPGKWKILARLFRYVFRYRFRIFAGIVLSFLVSIANLASLSAFVPIFNAMGQEGSIGLFKLGNDESKQYQIWLVDGDQPLHEKIRGYATHAKVWMNNELSSKSSSEAIIWLCLAIIPVYFLKILCVTGTIYFVGTAGLFAVRDLRDELYGKINHLGIDYFQKERTGMVMSRIINDVDVVGRSLSVEFNESLVNIFYIITHVALLAIISWKMLLIALIVVPLIVSPVSKFATRVRRAYTGQQERLAELGGHVQEMIGGIRVIRAFSMEGFERNRFKVVNERLYEHTYRGHYFHQVGPALTEFTGTVVVVMFLVWGAWQITGFAATGPYSEYFTFFYDRQLDRGRFFTFFVTLIFVMQPIRSVSVMVNLLSATQAAAMRIFEMLDKPEGVVNPKDPAPYKEFSEQIEYASVDFSYPGAERPALQDVSFTVKRGQTVSFVGSSGAGKSTLMDLLPRLYDVSSGAITIDGRDIRRLDLKDLRTQIGVVSQETFLFNATIRENIAYGRPDAPLDRVIEVCKAANADEFIQSLPEGYDTPIGERGVMLSGGQRQRIAIARALLLDPPILIFDEATSNLDNESEYLVQQAVERLLAGRTVFMIAHRLSTVYRSDAILVLENGRIVERGNHQELLDHGKIYRKLYELQFAENELKDDLNDDPKADRTGDAADSAKA